MKSKNEKEVLDKYKHLILEDAKTLLVEEIDIPKVINEYELGKNGLFLPNSYSFRRNKPKWFKVNRIIAWIFLVICAVVSLFTKGPVIDGLSITALIFLFGIFIGNNYFNAPFKNNKEFLKRKLPNFTYNTFLMISTLCFLRLTILLPTLMSINNSHMVSLLSAEDPMLGIAEFKQYLMFSDNYIYSFSFLLVLVFFVIRIYLNQLQRKKKYKNFCEDSINKWNYTLGTWFGLFTIFSTIAILGMG